MSALLPYGFEYAMMGGSVLLCLGGVVILVCLTEHPSRVGEESFFYNSLTPSLLYTLSLPLFPPHTPSSLSLFPPHTPSSLSLPSPHSLLPLSSPHTYSVPLKYHNVYPHCVSTELFSNSSVFSVFRSGPSRGRCRRYQYRVHQKKDYHSRSRVPKATFCLPLYFFSLSIHMSLLPFSSLFSHYHHFPLQMEVVRKQNRYCREQGSLLIVKVME